MRLSGRGTSTISLGLLHGTLMPYNTANQCLHSNITRGSPHFQHTPPKIDTYKYGGSLKSYPNTHRKARLSTKPRIPTVALETILLSLSASLRKENFFKLAEITEDGSSN